jgi:ATP-dependent exoDNAse (exonuclease V) alpha subunit
LTIYFFDAKIIGRGSERSAVGAAAYNSGEGLRDEAIEIVHDYSNKGGVWYKEIILPDNAPPAFNDRETLWNMAERAEIRRDAQLAREIIVALQKEFELQEQIALLREYIKENFVDKGMCADFSIHNKEDGNPHAHIMLTPRSVTPDGFGKKNTEWNSKNELLKWRKDWADITNRMFEEKGLNERIDHHSYKEQGIDKEPTSHLGHEAAALERQGIQTARATIIAKYKNATKNAPPKKKKHNFTPNKPRKKRKRHLQQMNKPPKD